jgi:hypothetical protein
MGLVSCYRCAWYPHPFPHALLIIFKCFSSGISVMSVSFMLANNTVPVVWRGPRKTQMILRYLRDVYWGKLDYLSTLPTPYIYIYLSLSFIDGGLTGTIVSY